uniref:ATP synthase F0 subunit 8 n=1 Tax=Prionospio fallax TaxID=3050094 RepID=A0AAU6QGQ5_9ANNE
MPHLAPLSWAFAPILFWLILLSLSASIWWSPSISFPVCVSHKSSPSLTSWNWI